MKPLSAAVPPANAPTTDFDLVIIGSGAAGMMAAATAAEYLTHPSRPTARIAILEKNSQPGIKVLVCGGGRCNLTNAGDLDFLIGQFGRNGRFLTPALRRMDNSRLRAWFASRGVPTHEEHDGKIYPDSNRAASIVNTLVAAMQKAGVVIMPDCAATDVGRSPGPANFTIQMVCRDGGDRVRGGRDAGSAMAPRDAGSGATAGGGTGNIGTLMSRYLLICCGGQSYTRMGTTGDGYRMAAALGHDIVAPRPAIVPLLVKESWVPELQGLAVPDVKVTIEVPGPLPRLATGKPTPSVQDLLFTHFGLSGPAVLNVSEIVAELLEKFSILGIRIDFVRHINHDQLRETFRHWHRTHGRKLLKTMLSELIPARLAEVFLRLAGAAADTLCAAFTAHQMHQLTELCKQCHFQVFATRGFKEAMVTAGGVRLDQVNPHTMESRICPGLFLAGEILDLTGPSGGYNLQLAFSTGFLAGECIADKIAATARLQEQK